MPTGTHSANYTGSLNVDGQSLPSRQDAMTPQNRINPRINLTYSGGEDPGDFVTLADVKFTAANLAYLYLYSSLVDATFRFSDGTNSVDIVVDANVPYIWIAGIGADNPMDDASPSAITAVTSLKVLNEGEAGGETNEVTTQVLVDIGLVDS